ncbi:MAG: spore germination protein GerW family protein [Tepidiformaceae bacterium]
MAIMDGERTRIESEVEARAHTKADDFIAALAEKVGGKANVHAAFGEPVTHGDVTIIPVAKVRWGFGGGGGSGTKEAAHESGSGTGGGGGAQASPMGYIELSGNTAEFRPIKDPSSLLPLMIGGAIAFWIAISGLRRLFR